MTTGYRDITILNGARAPFCGQVLQPEAMQLLRLVGVLVLLGHLRSVETSVCQTAALGYALQSIVSDT